MIAEESRVREIIPPYHAHTEHSTDYMNGFQCNITNSVSDIPVAKPQVPRRCGADELNNKHSLVPGNCTYGAKQPFYWFNTEQNNVRLVSSLAYPPPLTSDIDVRGCLFSTTLRRPVQLP